MVHSPQPLQLDTPQEWDLSDLYTDFDDPRLVQDIDSLEQTASQFRQQYQSKVKQLNPEQIVTCLQALEQIYQKSGYLYAYPSLVFAADTRNTEAKQFLDKVMEALTGIDNQLLFFELELKSLDSEQFSQLQASPAFKNYQHYLTRIAELRPYKLSEEVEQTRNRDSLT
ncbi:MAG: oligoendopeptidase F, partial [Desertifilum sp. SIO1I2]|nr:oligoendopeptidase F [Desertifilum sp. SIO1I2]